MSLEDATALKFGSFLLDLTTRELRRQTTGSKKWETVKLREQGFKVLKHLAQHSREAVSKKELWLKVVKDPAEHEDYNKHAKNRVDQVLADVRAALGKKYGRLNILRTGKDIVQFKPPVQMIQLEHREKPDQETTYEQDAADIRRLLGRHKLARSVDDQYIELYHSPEWRGWQRHEVEFKYLGDYSTPPELASLMQRFVPHPPIRGYFGLYRCSGYPVADENRPLVLEVTGGTFHHVYALNRIYESRFKDPECRAFRLNFEDLCLTPSGEAPFERSPLYHNVNAETVVITADQQFILGKRNEDLAFHGGSWSVTLEEQMLREDPDQQHRSDQHPFDAAERGVREELAVTVVSEKTRLLGIGIEWSSFTAVLIFLVYCAETFPEVVECWTQAKHDPYEAIALDALPATAAAVEKIFYSQKYIPSDQLRARAPIRNEMGRWHPIAKARMRALRNHLEFRLL